MAVTVTVQEHAAPPRVRIATDGAQVTRTDESGSVVTVRGEIEAGVIYDYEAPQGVLLTYAADTGGEAVVVMPDIGTWLVHLARPELSCEIILKGEAPVLTPARVSTVRTFSGRPFTAAAGSRDSISSEIEVLALDDEEAELALRTLLYDQSILFLSPSPRGDVIDYLGPRYIRVLDVDTSRPFDVGFDPHRELKLPYIVQDRPSVIEADAYGWDLMPTKWADMPTSWAGMP